MESVSLEPSCVEETPSPSLPAAAVRVWPKPDPLSVVRTAIDPQLSLHDAGERFVLNFLVDSSHPLWHKITKVNGVRRDSGTNLRVDPASVADQPLMYMVPLRNMPPTCPLDVILLNFLQDRRREVAEGALRQSQLVGLPYPCVSSLLNPVQSAPCSYAICKLFTDIIRTFPDCSTLPEQIGVLYHMFLLMRWQISPTQKNYDEMPDWITPRPAQLFTPHPAWVDYVLWPKMRDRIVLTHREYPFENWFIPYSRTVSCNWPHEPTDCLLHDTESDELIINPVFERHIRDLNNWSLGPAFAEAYPGLVDVTRIKTDKP
ncbi:hypothetical protein VTN96DRAFT_4395 [Rasamsonia emersonii]